MASDTKERENRLVDCTGCSVGLEIRGRHLMPFSQDSKDYFMDKHVSLPVKEDKFGLTVSELLLDEARRKQSSAEFRSGAAEMTSSISAGLVGTVSWCLADKALGKTKYGMAAKIGAAALTGGGTRYGVRTGMEWGLLEPEQRKASSADLWRGAVDAFSCVLAFKAEQAFSESWKARLAKRAELGVSSELLVEQGAKILGGNLGKRIVHNGLRGMVGGSAAGFVMGSAHALERHGTKLRSPAGLQAVGAEVAMSTLIGTAFGGVLGFGGTTIWNLRDIGGHAKAYAFGKGNRVSLDVHHFNDGHSVLLGEGSSLTRLATKAEQLQQTAEKAGRSSVLLDMGDSHSGTIFDLVNQGGKVEGQVIHRVMKTAATVPGNHAPDVGRPAKQRVGTWVENTEELARQLKTEGREFPGVAANVELPLLPGFTRQVGDTKPLYSPFRIVEVPVPGQSGKQKVALVGVVTDELQNSTPFLVEKDLLNAEARFGKLLWSDVVKQREALDDGCRALIDRLTANKAFNGAAKEGRTVQQILDEVFGNQVAAHKDAGAQGLHRKFIELARRHPDQTLEDIAVSELSDAQLRSRVQELARAFPGKKITDLQEVMVRPAEGALQETVKKLNQEGINKIIVMSHLGKSNDVLLARKVQNISAIFGGHSHDIEPVPLWIPNAATGREVPISQAGSQFRWLGESRLVFDSDGAVNRFLSTGRLHHIKGSSAEHAGARQVIDDALAATATGRDIASRARDTLLSGNGTEVVSLPIQLSDVGIRGVNGTQTPLASVIVDAVEQRGNAWLAAWSREPSNQKVLIDLFGKEVTKLDAVLLHSGGIRGGISPGPVHLLEIENIPLNKLCLARMTGADIRRALNFGVHDFPAADPSASSVLRTVKQVLTGAEGATLKTHDPSGNFLVVGNLKYSFDRSCSAHDRVTQVPIRDAAGEWTPIQEKGIYAVLTETHPIKDKWAKVPLIEDELKKTLSFDTIPSKQWVFGERIGNEESALAKLGAIEVSETHANAIQQFLRGEGSKPNWSERLSSYFRHSPIQDLSPGSWKPPVYPSLPALVTPRPGLLWDTEPSHSTTGSPNGF